MAHSTRLLQLAVAFCGVVPVTAGLAGVLLGSHMLGSPATSLNAALAPGDAALNSLELDSHYRYLSGLLLGIGLSFWSLIPSITRQGRTFRLLTALVVVGGSGRLLGIVLHGIPSPSMLFALGMELVVTPLLCVWQARVARSP